MPIKKIPIPSGYLKADMHCHTYHSGLTGHMKAFEPMDCYSSPQPYTTWPKKEEWIMVTITDHDSIDGCMAFLDKHSRLTRFFFGEEVTVRSRIDKCARCRVTTSPNRSTGKSPG